jgi:hypothetical protein
VSSQKRVSRDTRVPSARAVVRIQAVMPWRREVTIDSSTRLAIRTGRCALRESATASGSIFVYDFEPKPPPRYGTMIRTAPIGTSKSAAISAWVRYGCWQFAIRLMSPGLKSAIVVCVSIAYW